MRTFLKIVLLFVVLILVDSIGCRATSYFVEEETTLSSYNVSSSVAPSFECTFDNNDFSLFHSLHSSWSIDAELNGKIISEVNVFNHLRMRNKGVETIAFLKAIILQLSNREEVRALDSKKLYADDKSFSNASGSCDYYVFALRHILL